MGLPRQGRAEPGYERRQREYPLATAQGRLRDRVERSDHAPELAAVLARRPAARRGPRRRRPRRQRRRGAAARGDWLADSGRGDARLGARKARPQRWQRRLQFRSAGPPGDSARGWLDDRVPGLVCGRSAAAAEGLCAPGPSQRAAGGRRMGRAVSVDAGWSEWPAPAKLNLFLHITGRRPDGLHELQTVFQLLEWGDTVEVRLRADGEIRRCGGDTAHLPESEDLLVRAALALQAASDCRLGADLRVRKQIPAGGGF